MPITTTLKTGLRAGVVAIALAGATFAATVPAQAQSNPSFGFSLNFGNHDAPRGGITLRFGDDFRKVCVSNSQIRQGLQNRGYRDVRIVREQGDTKVYAIGRKNGDWWSMRVDRCTLKVDRVREIERSRDGRFSLRLSF